jgi:hypothetical protein
MSGETIDCIKYMTRDEIKTKINQGYEPVGDLKRLIDLPLFNTIDNIEVYINNRRSIIDITSYLIRDPVYDTYRLIRM